MIRTTKEIEYTYEDGTTEYITVGHEEESQVKIKQGEDVILLQFDAVDEVIESLEYLRKEIADSGAINIEE